MAWVTLGLLWFVYVFNMADRHILSILAQQVKTDLHLSDTETGLLIGPAIALLYAILGVPLSYIADRINRKRFIAASLALWSGFTALGGFAGNAWQLALSRVGVSAAEAGGIPASTSILADLFPAERRALAMGIYASASTAGICVSFALGGLIGHHYGWRAALFAAGIPGLILAWFVLTFVPEPVRGALDGERVAEPERLPMLATVRHIIGIRIYRNTLIAVTLLQLAIACTLSWGPAFAMRKFGVSAAEVGGGLGIGIAVLGGFCIVVAGIVIDRVGRDGLARAMRLVGLLQTSGIAFFLIALYSPNFTLTMLAFSALYGVMHFYVPAYYVVAQSFVPVRMRATTMAIGVLAMTVIGQGITPPLIGAVSDLLKSRYGDASLGLAMAPVVIVIMISAWQFFRVARLVDDPDDGAGIAPMMVRQGQSQA